MRVHSTNIELADIVLRRPSLDDVFLSLTGDSAGDRAPERVVGEVFS
jgi:ABC-2 type transport system ATP-binding protein